MKDKKKVLIAIIVILLLGIIFYAINNNSDDVTITFDSNGGTKLESQEIKKGHKLEEPEEPTREGYKFLGWYYDGEKFDFDQELTEDIKLEAKWRKVSEDKYTVTFDSNGGSTVDSQEVEKDEKVTMPENPTRDGYDFVEWTLDGETYSFDAKVTKDITLKAVWSKHVVANGTVDSSTDVEVKPVVKPDTGVSKPTESTKPNVSTKPNESTKPDESTKPVEPSEPTEPEEPTVTKYTVTFYDNGRVLSTQEVEEGKFVTLPETPAKDKFKFITWICGGNVCDFTQPVTADVDVTAVWKATDAYVSTLAELKSVLVDSDIENIYLAADIENIGETIYVNNTVTIHGDGNLLSFADLQKVNNTASGIVITADNTIVNGLTIEMPYVDGWNSHYAMQVYGATDVLVNNYTAYGADAALLVSGSTVELSGTTTVTDNEFGGIEVSRGSALTENGKLTVTGTVEMGDEASNHPAIWVENGQGSVVATGLTEVANTEKNQTYYFVNGESATAVNVSTLDELKAALDNSNVKTINIMDYIGLDDEILETLTVKYPVTINGNYYSLSFGEVQRVNGVASGLVIAVDDVVVNDLVISMDSDTGWQGNYAMQVYDATGVVVNNYIAYGADAALLVNGSEVELTGENDLSDNEFGGIEVSRGSGLTNNGKLTVEGTILMDNEASNCPAIWIENGQGSVVATGLTETANTEKNQTYYFVNSESVTTVNVSTLDELKAALDNSNVKTINFTDSIGVEDDILETLTVKYPVTINGNYNTLSFGELSKVNGVASGLVITADDVVVNDLTISMDSDTGWQGNYAMQVYDAKNVVINNYSAYYADAALLVNGSEVELTGENDLSDNEFGGIEVSRGSGLTENGKLTVTGTVMMSNEAINCPTIWIENGQGSVIATGLTEVVNTEREQTYYYLNEEVATIVNVDTLDELKAAFATAGIKTINLTKSIDNINEILYVNNAVTINGNYNTLSFGELSKVNGVASGLVITADDVVVNELVISMNSATGWQGNYAMQVYDATGVVVNNYTAYGADAALLVNGSEVELTGENNLSYNEFGGIEVSRGSGLTNNGKLTVTGTIVMNDEAFNYPTIWIENGQGSVVATGFTVAANTEKNQTYYFLNGAATTAVNVNTLDGLKAALADSSVKTINLTGSIENISETIYVNNTVTINGNYYGLFFRNVAKVNNTASGMVITADDVVVNGLVISMGSSDGWDSHYAMQVYDATGVVINNYSAYGADAALLVSGSEVEVTGEIDLSGNEFGGIEVSRGSALTNNGQLTVTGTIWMDDETSNRPAIWIEDGQGSVTATGLVSKSIVEKSQTYYFLDSTLATA